MTATEALERRIDELCSENERLRQDNAKLRGFWTHDGTWHVELPKLPEGIAVTTPDERDREVRTARAWRYVREDEAENAKLRELVRELWEGYNDPRCEDCPLKDKPACADCPICAREAAVIDRMRELGVDEC